MTQKMHPSKSYIRNRFRDRFSREGKTVGTFVRRSVRPSVRLFPFCVINRLTFVVVVACGRVMSVARLGLKVKVDQDES